MSDLTKLTAEELWGQFARFVPGSGAEICRKLKRLEQCEAALCGLLERHGNCLCSSCDAARAALERKDGN